MGGGPGSPLPELVVNFDLGPAANRRVNRTTGRQRVVQKLTFGIGLQVNLHSLPDITQSRKLSIWLAGWQRVKGQSYGS